MKLALLSAMLLPAWAADLTLATGGRSRYSITHGAGEADRFAADELRRYLTRIGSLKGFATAGPAIRIGGRSAAVDELLRGRSEDSFAVAVAGNDLYLTGNTPRANLYAVYFFLEKVLGCGWLQPGDDHVPQRPVIAIPADLRMVETPKFSHRSVNVYPYTVERAVGRADWAAKNRLNWIHICTNSSNHWEAFDSRRTVIPELRKRGLRLNYGGHTFNTWVPPTKYFAQHPEYFSLIDGKRNPAQLNIASPEVVRVAAEAMNAFLDANPEVEMIDLWLNDTTKFDESPEVQAMEGRQRQSIFGTMSRREMMTRTNSNIRFVNEIARRVAARHPNVFVQTLAYFQLMDAPDVRPEPNVMVGFAPIGRMPGRWSEAEEGYWFPLTQPGHEFNRLHLEEIRKWLKVIPPERFFLYEYYSHITTSGGMVNINTTVEDLQTRLLKPEKRGLHVYTGTIAADMQLYTRLGVVGVGTEDWDWDELNMYLYSRLMWNPELSAPTVIADYCDRSYGPAAAPMFRHWLVLHDARNRFRSHKADAVGFLHEARALATGPEERPRLETLATIWNTIQ